MNFFKSVFSDDPDPPRSESTSETSQNPSNNEEREDPDLDSPSNQPGSGGDGGWSFGGLMKTLATKSESVIETYRRDLKEFGSELKKEIEVAHGSLETVGHAIDELGNTVIKGTAQIISQGKDAILTDDHESDSSDTYNSRSQRSLNSKRYSRFDAQVEAVQVDASTYCEEPEDLDDYKKWKEGFVLEEKDEEIEGMIEENGGVKSIYERVVPDSVDHQTFWCRYFYKLNKLKQAEDLRANLVKRAISAEDEDLSWDVDDDDDDDEEEEEEEEEEGNADSKNGELGSEKGGKLVKEAVTSSPNEKEIDSSVKEANLIVKVENSEEKQQGESSRDVDEEGEKDSNLDEENKRNATARSGEEEPKHEGNEKDSVSKADDKVVSEEKTELSSKDSDVTVVSSQPSIPEEEDLGWDEIEDLSSIDDKKMTSSGSPNREELRKRLSAAEEDEDLSWDIEDDDDEPAKA